MAYASLILLLSHRTYQGATSIGTRSKTMPAISKPGGSGKDRLAAAHRTSYQASPNPNMTKEARLAIVGKTRTRATTLGVITLI